MADEKDVIDPDEIELEVVDDTPPEDRGREPMPKELVQELEQDELEDYSEKVKSRLKQMKKVWHDERREKEAALREQEAAIEFAKKIANENKLLKERLSAGEKSLVATAKAAAELELDTARKSFKEAMDSGDTDRILEAQEKLNDVQSRVQRLKSYKPAPQKEVEVEVPAPRQEIKLDPKTKSWVENNPWYGPDIEMTSAARGIHDKLEMEYGKEFVNSDKYWSIIDSTMRKRFPEYEWGDDFEEETRSAQRSEKPATVVAPVSRSTSAKKVSLKPSELSVAKKMGLTPQQYAAEKLKLEKQYG
jgi:hypothetical protein